MFSLKSLTSIRPFAESYHICCVSVQSPKSGLWPQALWNEWGKQKANRYHRAVLLPIVLHDTPAIAAESTLRSGRRSQFLRAHLRRAPMPRHKTAWIRVWIAPLRCQQRWLYTNLQVPAFWIPGSCSNYCCQVADPHLHQSPRHGVAFINSPVLVHRQVFTEGLLPVLCHMRTVQQNSKQIWYQGACCTVWYKWSPKSN